MDTLTNIDTVDAFCMNTVRHVFTLCVNTVRLIIHECCWALGIKCTKIDKLCVTRVAHIIYELHYFGIMSSVWAVSYVGCPQSKPLMMTSSNALLAFLCGIHPSPVNSPHKGQWRGASMFFFYLRRNQQLRKQWRRRWFETPSRSLWRHCNVNWHGSRRAYW